MKTIKTTYHRDGTVSFWNVYTQTWCRMAAGAIWPEILATLSATERTRIAKHAMRA